MNYLALANRLRAESSISGTSITTVTNQSGEYKKLIDWLNMAYIDIQNMHVDWHFLRKDFEFNTIDGVQNYSKTGIGLNDYGEWSLNSMRCYLTEMGVANEQHLRCVEWDDFRDEYLFGSMRSQIGTPYYVTQKPDNSLMFFPIPNDIYTINGEYFRKPHELIVDTDEPLFPDKFHMVIVYRALMMFAIDANAQELFAIGDREARRLIAKMEQVLLPHPVFSGALA